MLSVGTMAPIFAGTVGWLWLWLRWRERRLRVSSDSAPLIGLGECPKCGNEAEILWRSPKYEAEIDCRHCGHREVLGQINSIIPRHFEDVDQGTDVGEKEDVKKGGSKILYRAAEEFPERHGEGVFWGTKDVAEGVAYYLGSPRFFKAIFRDEDLGGDLEEQAHEAGKGRTHPAWATHYCPRKESCKLEHESFYALRPAISIVEISKEAFEEEK